jgi:hypothetical protein
MDELDINKEELDPSTMIVEEDEAEPVDDDIIDPLADDIDPITGKKKVDPEESEEDQEFEAYMFGDKYEEM